MSPEIPEEIPEEEMILSRDEEKDDLDIFKDFENDRLLDSKENSQEESYAAEAAQVLEAKFGRPLGEQTSREEYELRLNAQGEVIYLHNVSKGESPQRVTKDGEKLSFTSDKNERDTELFLGAQEFAQDLVANGFTARVDENNPDRGSFTAIISSRVENGITYIRYASECYNSAPVAKRDFEEAMEDTLSVSSAETQIKVALVDKTKKSVFESLFGSQGFTEKSVAEISIKDETIQSPAKFNDLVTLFPSSVIAVSSHETAQASPVGIFHEVAMAPVGTEVVIPGEPVRHEMEDGGPVVRDAMVVRRLDSGVSVSFVEGVGYNPFAPPLIQPSPSLWPAGQPSPSADAKAMADERLWPAGREGNTIPPSTNSRLEVFAQPQAEVVSAATAHQVEKNRDASTQAWQPDAQHTSPWNEQLALAIDGLPRAVPQVNAPFSEPSALVLAESVFHNPSHHLPASPHEARQSGDAGDTGSLKARPESITVPTPRSEPPTSAQQLPEAAPERHMRAFLTPGVRKESNSAQFLDLSPFTTADPILTRIVVEPSVVFDQAPSHLETRVDSTEPTTAVNQEKQTVVQHEPTFQAQPRYNNQDHIILAPSSVSREPLQTTAPTVGDPRKSIVATVEPVRPLAQPEAPGNHTAPVIAVSPGRVESESSKLTKQSHPEKTEKVFITTVETKVPSRRVVTASIETVSSASAPEPAYLFAPLITSVQKAPRHIIRIEANTIDEAQQQSPSTAREPRPELISEIRRRASSPSAPSNSTAQVVVSQAVRTTTQAA